MPDDHPAAKRAAIIKCSRTKCQIGAAPENDVPHAIWLATASQLRLAAGLQIPFPPQNPCEGTQTLLPKHHDMVAMIATAQ